MTEQTESLLGDAGHEGKGTEGQAGENQNFHLKNKCNMQKCIHPGNTILDSGLYKWH